MGAHDLSPTSAVLDAYDRAVGHDKGTGFETCQMSLPNQPRSRQKTPTINASRASARTHKPRSIFATARSEFPPWRLPHAIKAAPAIRVIRRWSSNWTNAALRLPDPPGKFARVNRGTGGPPFYLGIRA